MLYKNYIPIFFCLLIFNCTTTNVEKNNPNILFENEFRNRGFALIYNDKLYNKKIISKKLEERSLIIFQKNLKKNTQVKITNILNNKSLVVSVGKKSDYPSFNNVVISDRIAKELNLDIEEPYVEIIALSKNSLFLAKKAKTFDEEKKVALKVPVNDISINDLNQTENKSAIKGKNLKKEFSYIIKIGDFYFKDTSLMMIKRIKNETKIKNPKNKKISDKKYRVYLGPFENIVSIQKSYKDINVLGFENIEIIKND